MLLASFRLAAPDVRRVLSSALKAAFLSFALARAASAQTLFYDADATINTDISGYDVVIGTVNPNPFTVTIAPGALVDYNFDLQSPSPSLRE